MVAELVSAPSATHRLRIFPSTMSSGQPQASAAAAAVGMNPGVATTAADPGWPPASGADTSARPVPPAKRFKMPTPAGASAGPVMSQEELTTAVRVLQAQRAQDQTTWGELKGILDEYAQRIERLEDEDLQLSDKLAEVADSCRDLTRAADAALRVQLDSYSRDVAQSIGIAESALKKVIVDVQTEFATWRDDLKMLLTKADEEIVQIEGQVAALEVHMKNAGKEPFFKGGAYNPPGPSAEYHNIASPCKGADPMHGWYASGAQTYSAPNPGTTAGPGYAAPTGPVIAPQRASQCPGYVHPATSAAPGRGPQQHTAAATASSPEAPGAVPQSAPQGYAHLGPRGPTGWPPATGNAAKHGVGARIFETKFAQESKNQFAGVRGGEAWKVLIRGYLLGRAPIMKFLLKWAEDFGTMEITSDAVQGLKMFMDEDPEVMDHLLWAFLNINLTGAAREIFCNCQDSQGLEAWRRINRLIFSRTEQRHDELYKLIHNPRSASNPAEVQAVLEEWTTNQRLFKEIGGVPLREDELRNLVLKVVPAIIRDQLIFKLRDFKTWNEIKEYVHENARLLMVYGRSSPAKLVETAFTITDEFLERTGEMPLEQAVLELGSDVPSEVVVDLVEKRRKWQAQKARPGFKRPSPGRVPSTRPAPTSPVRVPTTTDGKPMCSNCGGVGHAKDKCPQPKAAPDKRPCFRCGKTGHRSSACKSGLPAKSLEDENYDEEHCFMCSTTDSDGAYRTDDRHGVSFEVEDSDDDDEVMEPREPSEAAEGILKRPRAS